MVRSSRLAALLMILALDGGAVAAAKAPSLDAARAALEAGDRETARTTLDSLLTHPAGLPPADAASAALLRAQLEDDGAAYERRLRELADADLTAPQRALVQMALGEIAFLHGDLAFALRAFRDAREQGGGDAAALWVGLTTAALGDGAAAREVLEPLADSEDRAVRQRALLAVGDSYRAAERWSEARGAYRKLRGEKTPGPGWWAAATLDEAECAQKLDEVGDAKKLLQELLERTPGAYEAPVARGRLDRLEAQAPETPEASPEGETGKYSIQVGAFSVSENADGLLARIQARGVPKARVVHGKDGLYRVLLGRFEDRAGAESLGDSLSTELGLGFSVVKAP